MILNHICSSFKVGRVEVFEEEGIVPDRTSLGKIPYECFNADIDPFVPGENLFAFVEGKYGDAGFSCDRPKEKGRKDPDGSALVHLRVQSAAARSLVVMLRRNNFFSLSTFSL